MKKIKYIIIKIWKLINNIIYIFFKMFRTKNKISFISRQTNGNNIDFDLIIEEIKKQNRNIKIVVLNKMIGEKKIEKIKYAMYIYYQMYHIATSKIVIIDGYCIPVCTLHHKKNLIVIQIWHALGSLKKLGYSILGKREGRKKETALTMDMHKNYTYILTSSGHSKKYFKKAFNATDEQMKIIPLPRVDFLKSDLYKKKSIEKFYNNYKDIKKNKKKKILYAPTFRKNEENDLKGIIQAIDYEKYDLIIKTHDDTELVYYNRQEFLSKKTNLSGLELLHIADYVITDYSAIVYEAAVVEKPVYFWAYDYESYIKKRGFYINYKEEMPGPISKDIKNVLNAIENNNYDYHKLRSFRKKYIKEEENCTKRVVSLIIEVM